MQYQQITPKKIRLVQANPLVSETYVIKSILVTSAGTPSCQRLLIMLLQLLNQQQLTANTTSRIINPTANSSRGYDPYH